MLRRLQYFLQNVTQEIKENPIPEENPFSDTPG